jgi:MFS family permease
MVLGGCLAMVYAVGIGSPATTEFFRAIGAQEVHFGLIGGLPLIMLLMQFAGAALLEHTASRKRVFIAGLITCRLLYLGVAFLPLVRPARGSALTLPVVIALLAVSAAAHNLVIPAWYSWMADLIPRQVLNRVWGWRQRAMHITWTVASLLVTLFLFRVRRPPTVVFPALTVVAVAAGVCDVLLFLGVPEPPNPAAGEPFSLAALLGPARHPEFGRFVLFSGAWSFATTYAAAFMQLYALKELGVAPWQATLIWCSQGLGTACASGMWGRLADRFGHRPVLKVCVTLKPMIVIVFLLLTPRNVAWLLPLAFFPDGMLNAGSTLATNGYMLTIAPRRNRSMFIAAITGLSGVCGGLAAVLSGAVLKHLGTWSVSWCGRCWNRYHVVFATSLLLRLCCRPLARRIREPGAARSRVLLTAMMDEWPAWLIRFPVGLFRRPPRDDDADT